MKVRIRYFATLRERVGMDSETLDVPDRATVATAFDTLIALHPEITALRPHVRAAVNQEFVADDHPLSEGDELVFIPPVAGGGPRYARVLDAPLSLDRVVTAVSGPDAGGIVTFTGQVRRHSRGKDVERLEYEAFVEMTEKVFSQLCESIEAEFPGTRLALEHRVGALQVGDVAVVIAAAAPHRKEAFDACRAMIDRLKESAPIWKKEIGPDGEEWVGLGP
jgi:molybdopterin synthase catalytic subunit